jgi:phosphatidylserine decarboxylase
LKPPLWLRLLPRTRVSRLTGRLAELRIPRALRRRLYGAYARRYGADLSEMEGELADFVSFGAFFGRPLKAGSRPIAGGEEAVVSPADGTVVSAGRIAGTSIPQVKGIDYTLAELFAGDAGATLFAGGAQATVYLAPGDYHRVHAPLAGAVRSVIHVPGDHFPVNAPSVQSVPGLFARNERVIVLLRSPTGADFAVVMVGALNVGSIRLAFRAAVPRGSRTELDGPELARGAEVGAFALGSTVIVLLQEPARVSDLPPGTRVRVGQAIGISPLPRP